MTVPTRIQILRFFHNYTRKHKYPPSFREIANGVYLCSLASVYEHLNSLERDGYLTYEKGQSRTVVLTDKGEEKKARRFFGMEENQ